MKMWLITDEGFFSIVQKPLDALRGTLTVRARVLSDLKNLKKRLPDMGEITTSKYNDYRYRATAPREQLAAAVEQMVRDICYDNFKDEVTVKQGQGRADIYSNVWANLYDLQRGP
jgi:hypothetical protein